MDFHIRQQEKRTKTDDPENLREARLANMNIRSSWSESE
jgi:hypothetical protein